MVNIDDLKTTFEYLVNHIRQGKIKPSQIDTIAYLATNSLFLQRLGLPENMDATGIQRVAYSKNRKIHTDLTPFKKSVELVPRQNKIDDTRLPEDMVMQTALRYYYVVEDTPKTRAQATRCGCMNVDEKVQSGKKYITYEGIIDLVEEDKWSLRATSSIIKTAMYCPFAAHWEFKFPVAPTKVRIDYLARPVRPKWNFTQNQDGSIVYNPTGSVHLEWDATLTETLANRMADIYSRNVSDQFGVEYSQRKMEAPK